MTTVMILLILFQLKHFIADYPLQNAYMLGKFKDKGWVKPLAAHCGVHALFTFIIGLFFGIKIALICATIDFVLHFIMDRVKASPKLLGRYEAISKGEFKGLIESKELCEHGVRDLPKLGKHVAAEEARRRLKEINNRFESNVKFWWSLGLDQGVHHLTHYLIIYLLVM